MTACVCALALVLMPATAARWSKGHVPLSTEMEVDLAVPAGRALRAPRVVQRCNLSPSTIVAATCPACGSLRISRGGTVIATRSLVSRTADNDARIAVKLPAVGAAQPITLTTTSSRPARIDAVELRWNVP